MGYLSMGCQRIVQRVKRRKFYDRYKTRKNVLVIGNGFDLYHCLPTRYIDFINVVNRLLELADEQRLQRCSYINYMFGTGSTVMNILKNAIRFTVILCVMSN